MTAAPAAAGPERLSSARQLAASAALSFSPAPGSLGRQMRRLRNRTGIRVDTDNDAFRNYPKMDMALFYYGYTLQGGKYLEAATNHTTYSLSNPAARVAGTESLMGADKKNLCPTSS